MDLPPTCRGFSDRYLSLATATYPQASRHMHRIPKVHVKLSRAASYATHPSCAPNFLFLFLEPPHPPPPPPTNLSIEFSQSCGLFFRFVCYFWLPLCTLLASLAAGFWQFSTMLLRRRDTPSSSEIWKVRQSSFERMGKLGDEGNCKTRECDWLTN